GPDCRSENVLAVIANSYFRPQALGEFDARTVATAKALIREANILRDRTSYAAAADRFAQLAERRPVTDEDEMSLAPEALLRAGDMLAALFDLTGKPLSELAESLHLQRSVCDQADAARIARDLRALAAMEAALASLDGSPPLRALRDALRTVRCPPARSESIVDILDALDARACRADHVVLLGLTESLFPRALTETPLLTEARRRRLAGRGLAVDVRSDLAAREMLLFYLSASRAERTLTLGTLESDAAGKPCGTSPFLSALAAPVGGLDALPTQHVTLGQFVPEIDSLTSGADAVNRTWGDLFAPDAAASPALAWMQRYAPDAAARAAMGLWASDRRWQAGRCDAFDGHITDADLQKALAARYPGDTVFSASQLETYAHCPWRYFARYVLGLDEPPSRQPHMDAALRGKIVHEILFELLTALADAHGRPLDLKTVSAKELTTQLKAVADRVSDRMRRRFSPPYPTLWQVQVTRLVTHVRRYLDACHADAALPGRPVRFELAFGMAGADVDDEPEDATSAPQPVVISTPDGDIRLRGRIDRIDSVASEAANGLLVVDYKTGALPSRARINECQNVQLPLYALAAEALLDEPCLGGMYQRIADEPKTLLCARIKRSGKPDDTYDATLEATRQAVGRYVSAMAAGVFDVLPVHDCPPFCPFRQICQFTERRSQLKTPAEDPS
ncbi:MAG: PD-(D/E)XK nuclease family protein, partial [Planctomycetota bacterium]